jgi:NADPH:quinone reductase-like Zn-dependent oxidoreductase
LKSWILTQFGPEGLQSVDRKSKPISAGEIRIKLLAISLNYRDWLVVTGRYDSRMKLPFAPCSDGVGIVTEIAPDVRRFKVGDRVIPAFSQSWVSGEFSKESRIKTLGGPLDGTLAGELVVSAYGAVKAPSNLTNFEAATLGCAGLTAWNALSATGHLKPGDTVLVQGSGGVSIFALQIAKKIGAKVAVVSGSVDRFEKLREIGADFVVDYHQHPAWSKTIRDWTGGRGVDHVVDIGGAGTIQQSIAAVRSGGRISLIGMLSGGKQEIDLVPIFMNAISLQGIYVGSVTMLEDFCQMIENSDLRPLISRQYAFDDLPEAMLDMGSGRTFGKLVVSAED